MSETKTIDQLVKLELREGTKAGEWFVDHIDLRNGQRFAFVGPMREADARTYLESTQQLHQATDASSVAPRNEPKQ